ncbi:MAG: asparagine synthase (glutamine-hydrolyzing) [Desulfobacteraceae bacterium]|nr:asparagine synthase (glutamine-hydrolyzing) [Desulfobacteraceae bacterium]
MCGIAGIFSYSAHVPRRRSLERMVYTLTHRGPDGYGFFADEIAGLAHARLSIVDVEGGWQPIPDEAGRLWLICNGEIFNHPELRAGLQARGHRFRTDSDVEVILHLYEEKGPRCLADLNGQFALALYDRYEQSLFLARDRLGILPLFYARHQGAFYFGSEMKAIFAAEPGIPRRLDPEVLAEIFAFWAPVGERTVFEGVRQLEPGHWATVSRDGTVKIEEYWDFPKVDPDRHLTEGEAVHRLREILGDAVRLRLRADVEVGAYLSGGLDSSTIAALGQRQAAATLRTFSVTFEDAVFDESEQQQAMVRAIGTCHRTVGCTGGSIGAVFPEVVRHIETPILRTAPVPLYLLSGLVRESGCKVVLTGEGADEVWGGYDLFKEAKIRAFMGKDPGSALRPLLLKRLYPYLALSPTRSAAYASRFFASESSPERDPFFAHRPRWKTNGQLQLFFSPEVRERCNGNHMAALEQRFAGKLEGLDYFSRAQYLESKLLLANYLLCSQSDRVAMAHSVEARFPFLDHRMVELAWQVPPLLRMKALNEKNILRKAAQGLVPEAILARKKQPYMAPDLGSFFGRESPEYLDYYLSPVLVREAGLLDPEPVAQLLAKCRQPGRRGFRDSMAFVGILSTQILYETFVRAFACPTPEVLPNVRIGPVPSAAGAGRN